MRTTFYRSLFFARANFHFVLGYVGLFLWLSSLATPVFYDDLGRHSERWEILLEGIFGIFFDHVAWAANLTMLWIIVRFVVFNKYSGMISGTLCLVALASFSYKGVDPGEGHPLVVIGHGVGFYIWNALSVYLFLIALIRAIAETSLFGGPFDD